MKNRATNRREFFGRTIGLGAAGALTSVSGLLAQQKVTTGIRSTGLYDDTLIIHRKPFTWPGGKTIAVWIVPNVEVWSFDSAVDAAVAPNGAAGPDVINYATREYGLRVGLWRIADVMDSLNIKATVALNAGVCEFYPKAIEELKKRPWEFAAHGITNSVALSGLSAEEEKRTIQISIETIQKATGKKVSGWISPGAQETSNTLEILGQLGVSYTGDWANDDQPYRMKVKTGDLYALPYNLIVDDNALYAGNGFTGEQYYQSVVDQFDQLALESQKQPRVLGLPIHPNLVGQPEHIAYFKRALQHIKQSDRVWLATGSEIVEAYRKVKA